MQLCERLAESLMMSHLTKRFALLLPLTDWLRWVAEGEGGQHLHIVGNVQQRIDRLHALEADPVRLDAFRPRGQQHGLNRPARVGDSEWAFLNRDNDRQRCLVDIRAIGVRWQQCCELVQRAGVLDDDEVSGLGVLAACGHATRLDNLLDDGL